MRLNYKCKKSERQKEIEFIKKNSVYQPKNYEIKDVKNG